MSELGKCPSCGGLLAHRSDLAFQWKSCFACGRQFDEKECPKMKINKGYAPPDRQIDPMRGKPRSRKK